LKIKGKEMKVFWWQAGLHFEPESEEDRKSLMSIWSAKKVLPDPSKNEPPASIGVIGEQFVNRVI
jgi:hypothetical protein